MNFTLAVSKRNKGYHYVLVGCGEGAEVPTYENKEKGYVLFKEMEFWFASGRDGTTHRCRTADDLPRTAGWHESEQSTKSGGWASFGAWLTSGVTAYGMASEHPPAKLKHEPDRSRDAHVTRRGESAGGPNMRQNARMQLQRRI